MKGEVNHWDLVVDLPLTCEASAGRKDNLFLDFLAAGRHDFKQLNLKPSVNSARLSSSDSKTPLLKYTLGTGAQ